MPGDPHTAREPGTARVVLGLGASRDCPPEELAALADQALAEAGLARSDVYAVASATVKADEPAILALAAALGVPARFLDAKALAAVQVPTPSAVVASHVGTPSVAEAAALLVAADDTTAGRLLVPKRRSAHATCAVATPATSGSAAAVPWTGPTAAEAAMPPAAVASDPTSSPAEVPTP